MRFVEACCTQLYASNYSLLVNSILKNLAVAIPLHIFLDYNTIFIIQYALMDIGLRELCSKFCSLCYSEFPKKLDHYAHFMLLIVMIIPLFL